MNSKGIKTVRFLALATMLGFLAVPGQGLGQPKSSKEIIQKRKADTEKSQMRPAPPPTRSRPHQARIVVPRKPVRRHIRWAMPTDEHNEVDFHAVFTRSTRNLGFSIDYFDDQRRREIELAIASFRDNRRDDGYNHWHRFLVSLETFEKPVDLEPVMYYVLREGCLRQDPNVLFYAERLERTRSDLDSLEEYWDDLYRIQAQCTESAGRCLEAVERRIEDELELVGQERDLARSRVRIAQRALDRAQLTSSGEVTQSVDVFFTVAQEMTRRTEVALHADSD